MRKHQTIEEVNFKHLVGDIAWFGLALAATSRFLSIYAIRLGASPFELSLLAALPGIVLLISTGFSGWWRKRYSATVKAIAWPALAMRFVFLLPAFAPFFPAEWQPVWLILAISLPALPQGVAGAIFISMMRESISQSRMTSLLSRRSLALNVTVGLGAVAFGILLEELPFPLNYQVMFLIAFVFSLMSQWHVVNVKVLAPVAEGAVEVTPQPEPEPEQPKVQSKPSTSSSIWRSRGFQAVAFVALLTHMAFFSIVMITPLRMVEDLDAGEGFIAMFGLAELVAGAMAAMFADRVIRWFGTRTVIAAGMVGTALAAMIIGGATVLEITLLAALISGASWTAGTIGIFSYLFECTPKEDSTRSSAAYQQAIALGIFIGPMLGGMLVDLSLSLVQVILIGAALRLLAGILIYYNVFTPTPLNTPRRERPLAYPLRALYGRSRRG